MPRKPKTKSKKPANPRFPKAYLQSRRFRRWVAIGILLSMGLTLVQFTASVRLSEARMYRLPISPTEREQHRSEIVALLPAYTLWHWWAKVMPLPAGQYQVRPGESAFSVWNRFRRGLQTPIRFYLRPQRSPAFLAGFLGRVLAYDSTTWYLAFRNYPWAEIGMNAETWPLLFLPDVYEVYWTTTPQRLIERMRENYQHFWNEERRKKAESLGLTPVEVGILASIVEQETYRASERPLIASVYLNRLRLGMPLQADPTVIYAIGDFSIMRVTHRMLEVDSPYNTYRRRGLPPGPIGIPSIESIEAVLNYTPSSYLYFCARPDGSGYHDFSQSYTEHLAKARSYQKALNRWLSQKK